MKNNQEFWEECWQQGTVAEYETYLSGYYRLKSPVADLFQSHNVKTVCDAACGFGAYSLMLASYGFLVEGFDISPTSVEVTKELLQKYDIDTSKYKVASIVDTGYEKEFDAVTAHSVLDHLSVADAKRALDELLRIAKPGGLVMISFDGIEEDDLELPHEVTADGSFLYKDGNRNGMLFHYYEEEELETWLAPYSIIWKQTNSRGERFFVIQK